MSDYRVKVTVRNDRLLRAIESKGYVAGQKFAEAAGVPYVTINNLISLKQSAIGSDGELRPAVEKLCAFLGAMPSELFTESALYHRLESNSVELSMDEAEAMQMLCPSEAIEQNQLSGAIERMLDSLPSRGRRMIELRFGIGCKPHTLEEAGDVMGFGKERARRLEAQALRIMRHPSRTKEVLELMQ